MKTVTLEAHVGLNRLRIAASGDLIRDEVRRPEGDVTMQLVDPVLSIECEGVDFGLVHGDILALIGVLAFHPALPDEPFQLRTRFPVSPNLKSALNRAWILEGVSVRGEGSTQPYQAERDAVLSYGGGLDSLAAHLLFPEAPLVHETPLPARDASYSDVVNEIIDAMPVESHKVYDNLRQLFTAWGLPLWVSVYAAALILQPRWIISGSEMTGTYLLGGQRYHPRYGNLWYRVFSDIGVGILPTSFLSEIGNATVVAWHGRLAEAAYCQRISLRDCGSCPKCLRRRMIRGAINPAELRLVDEFTRSEQTDLFLARRPLYYGDVFVHAAALQIRPTWVNEAIQDLIDRHGRLPFHDRYYPDTFSHFSFPSHLQDQAEKALAQVGVRPFDEETRRAFESYEQVLA